MERVESWGRVGARCRTRQLWWRDEPVVAGGAGAEGTLLPYGLGRSYGDSCLDEGGTLLLTRRLDRYIAFDPMTGLLACEAGVTLGEVLRRFAPRGFFLPVVPGTKHVTVGGAIANDVHGKNHHRAGSFGVHVTRLELARSDGRRVVCSREENGELFAATVGGLGLTGLVTWAELRLRPIRSEHLVAQTVPFASLEAFLELSAASNPTHEYTVAWIDLLASQSQLGRGLFYRAVHADGPPTRRIPSRPFTVPFDLPAFVMSPLAVRAFNALYRWRGRRAPPERLEHYDPFFFPLDGLERWNRVYGRRGLRQFQCVLPLDAAQERPAAGMRRVLERVARSGQGSFLAVLKTFGEVPSPGLLSFPRKGVTLALDFANRGERTAALLRELEALVMDLGGALYPAKDACMSPAAFRASFPGLEEFARHVDPRFSSSFWRRVTGEEFP